MNRREVLKRIAGVAGAGMAMAGITVVQPKEFVRMRAGDRCASHVKVFLDGVDVTRDCCAVDTQRGEVELLSRPLRVVNDSMHKYFRTGSVRVELDGKVYTS